MAPEERHSEALEAELIADPEEKAHREARNVLRQFDSAVEQIEFWTHPGQQTFKLRPSAIMALNRVALDGLSGYAGVYRPAGIAIGGSKHTPPGAHLVPELVEQMCEYVNENWNRTAVHLASYVLWRLNWIHPFVDGNGRTSRIVSFVVLCVRTGYRLPGTNTVPDQISRDKNPYYQALELADAAYQGGESVEVSAMEKLVGQLLANQLASVIQDAQTERSRPTA
ncbi:MAG TPA: Fic family protein [Candidatus Aquilonibacter sp.]|nr:Fic family protein [Candidatus Aquilonibacter sp.]